MNSLTVLLAAILLLQALILCLMVQLRQIAKASRQRASAMTSQQARSADTIERQSLRRAQPEPHRVGGNKQYCRIFPALDTAQTLPFDPNVFDSDNHR